MNNVVEALDLKKLYGQKEALGGVSVNIPEHSICGLVGRNGSGKTTFLKIIAGLLNHTEGKVTVFGEEVMDNLAVLNKLIYSYPDMAYDSKFSLKTILLAYQSMFANFDLAFASGLMRYFDLNEKARYRSLSQGMRSVFNFICALSSRTELTLLDEPVLGIDVATRKSVYEILLRDYTEHPRTFIISSHLLSEIESVLSDILLIEQGKVVLHNPLDDVRQSAYRIDGNYVAVESFVRDKKVITLRKNELSCYAIIQEQYNELVVQSAKAQGMSVSTVRAEELCMYLTSQNKEGELECLWQNPS